VSVVSPQTFWLTVLLGVLILIIRAARGSEAEAFFEEVFGEAPRDGDPYQLNHVQKFLDRCARAGDPCLEEWVRIAEDFHGHLVAALNPTVLVPLLSDDGRYEWHQRLDEETLSD
jgi:hypothetical protein